MKNFKQKLLLTAILSGLLFFISLQPAVRAQEEKTLTFSLSLQSLARSIFNKILQALPFVKDENYKDKYFKLLKEFAELKLQEKEIKISQSFEAFKEKYPNAVQLKTLKLGEFGLIYLESSKEIKTGAVVVDENFLLVGKVYKVKPNFVEARSLEYPGLEFNLANLDKNLLGLGQTSGLGYIEIDFVDPKIKKLEKDELIMTFGQDKVFPANFIVGRVAKLEKQTSFQKALIEPIADFSADSYFVIQ